jgi:N-acetylneuraminate synthase
MASLGEVETALAVLRGAGAREIALLHCISIYPPDPNDVHLNNIATLARAFDVPVGFSDHTQGTAVPLAAVAAGACILEKHFTLDKDMPGWDHWVSADPGELREIVSQADVIRRAMGSFVRTVSPAELEKRKAFRRSIVTARAVRKGERLTLADLDFKRPGKSIPPDAYPRVVGRAAARDLDADQEIAWEDLA